MTLDRMSLTHIFVDHSNIWGGARLASQIRKPEKAEEKARVSVKRLDEVLHGRRQGVTAKVVSGGVPPGMEALWVEYQNHGYNTQRLFRDEHWKERGVDHTIIGHMWRMLHMYRDAPTVIVLASGDGKTNEFGTSFYEVLNEVLRPGAFPLWRVELASFHWRFPEEAQLRSPTSTKMLELVHGTAQAQFINLFDRFDKLVYYQRDKPGSESDSALGSLLK